MARHPHPRQTFRPRLEALEERWCPAAVDYLFRGDTLFVLGTQGPDRIDIADLGDGHVRAASADGRGGTFEGVGRVVVQARGGNDVVSYKLLGGPDTSPADLDMNLG